MTTPKFLQPQPEVLDPEPEAPTAGLADPVSPEAELPQPNPRAGRPLSARHKEFARLVALGTKSSEIARILGIGGVQVSVLKRNPRIMVEVEKFQERMFEKDMGKRLRDMAPDAADVIEGILVSEDPNVKIGLKKETATWVLEKVTGRPKQEIDIQSSSLQNFIEMLQDAKIRGEPIDVTPEIPAGPSGQHPDGASPEAQPEESAAARWARENLG